ncbi:hypothetical protein [Rhizobium sp. EC-SD404]|uniref:hypothetical protein n=1 Tax=Rhizobium sp. EC-SD404 TaxID=2038389 RepID=UPI0012572794|nr:hypothetical protein [Rhizobium sp. EC-SD404]VVS98711.1 hypothetical protein RHIZ404_190109 [Rhizobium sp. EC-SD404]
MRLMIDRQVRLIGARIAVRDGQHARSALEIRVATRLIRRICRPIRDPVSAETMRTTLLDAYANLTAAIALGLDPEQIAAMENEFILLVIETQARAKRDMH